MRSNRSSNSRVVAALRWAVLGVASVAAAAAATSGCLERPLCDTDCRPKTTNVFVDAIEQQNVDKIDLLFMIDNSISMADKQEILSQAVPDLVRRLVNPVCVAADGTTMNQAPELECPAGMSREFNAVNDIHIGVITSSLGSGGSDICPTGEAEKNDRAHLLGSLPRAQALGIPEGFLAWGPGQEVGAFSNRFVDLVTLSGEQGCGYEQSLEAWYRFLIDPEPYADIRISDCSAQNTSPCAFPEGVDQTILAQRKAFLRANSLVAIVMLSDENDCSINAWGQNYYVAVRNQEMYRGSSACNSNPNDPCCYSCGFTSPPAGCAADPICEESRTVPRVDDAANVRCMETKRRFGYDFLYPTQRYVNALREFQICMDPGRPDLSIDGCPEQFIKPNPLFQDLSGAASAIRSPGLVFLAGIVGVPWQDLQTDVDPQGNPVPPGQLRFKTAQQMNETGTWGVIVGDPKASPPIAPLDALMHESVGPRTGGIAHALNQPLQAPSSGYLANAINGHEWNTSNGDLQYACIFPLIQEINCEGIATCDCSGDREDINIEQNPLCQRPDGSYSMIQRYAKAYPGTRHLEVLKDFGLNSIVASICAKEVNDTNAADYGYRPAITALVDRLKDALQGSCLPREVALVDQGPGQPPIVPCSVVEAIPEAGAGCGRESRTTVEPRLVGPAFQRLRSIGRCGAPGMPACDQSAWTLCEIQQAGPDCLTDENPTSVGWCYVDPDRGIGSSVLVEKCDADKRRLLRFVGGDVGVPTPAQGAIALIACLGADLQTGGGSSTPAPPPEEPPPEEPPPEEPPPEVPDSGL